MIYKELKNTNKHNIKKYIAIQWLMSFTLKHYNYFQLHEIFPI